MHIRPLTQKDFAPVFELAVKAIHEKGWAGIDFNLTEFNHKCKQLFVSPHNVAWGLFVEDRLIGFTLLVMNQMPWKTKVDCYVDLMHIEVKHRTLQIYQQLFQKIKQFCDEKDIDTIKISDTSIGLEDHNITKFLMGNDFERQSTIWERHNEN